MTRQHSDSDSEQGSLDVGACCLCHSSLDYTDRAAFFRPDRMEDFNEDTDNEDDYVFRPSDPYLPVELYDEHNALLYCDGCERLYHQKCHFTPVTVVPRGDWHCLLCTYFTKGDKTGKVGKQKAYKTAHSTKTLSSTTTTVAQSTDPALYQKMYDAYRNNRLFVSPPVPAVQPLEQAWEYASRHLKATHLQSHSLKRLRNYVAAQASNYRLAETAVTTLTGTNKNRHHFVQKYSQELAQTLVKFYGVRRTWRAACTALHDVQRATDTRWRALQAFCDQAPPEFVQRVLFPFGRQYPRRTEPRTAEAGLNDNNNNNHKDEHTKPPAAIVVTRDAQKKPAATKRQAPSFSNDDDSGISLDDLQCCVCRTSEATDENDLVLCDGQGCFRAYHAHCLSPALQEADLEENVDWFCPLCSTLADLFLTIQTIHMGDEWEQERYATMGRSDMDSSLQSWDHVDQVFPTAEADYAAACQMRDGKRNKATDDLLARVLGLDALSDHDDDDEVEDGNFDLEAYQQERQQRDDEHDDDHSSQATLVEMSSVELEVDKAELDALSGASSDDDDDDSEEDGRRARRSRRLRKGVAERDSSVSDIGAFDEANIIQGKRGRKPVDYIKLNQAIFGDEPDKDSSTLDDTEDFEAKKSRPSDSDSSDDESDDSDSSSNDESSDVEEGSDEEESEETTKASEKKKPQKKAAVAKVAPRGASRQTNGKRKASDNGRKGPATKKPRRNGVTVINGRNGTNNKVSSPRSSPRTRTSPRRGK